MFIIRVRVKTLWLSLSAHDHHWWNSREEKLIEGAAIYISASVPLTGSMPCKMAEGLKRVLAPYRNQTHVTRLTVTLCLTLETPFIYAHQSNPLKLCQILICLSVSPRALPLNLQLKLLIVCWNSLWDLLPDNRQGLELEFKLELRLCPLNNKF